MKRAEIPAIHSARNAENYLISAQKIDSFQFSCVGML